MAKYSLSSYTIAVKEVHGQRYVDISNYGDNNDVFNFIRSYLDGLISEYSHDRDEKKLLWVERIDVDGRYIKGIIKTGEYGHDADLCNVLSGEITHRRTPEEAELLPFYYLIFIPNNSTRGLMVLQRFGNKGIRSTILKAMEKEFRSNQNRFSIEITPKMPEQILMELFDRARLTRFRFIKNFTPSDLNDYVASGSPDSIREVKNVELVLTTGHGRSFSQIPRIREFFDGRRDIRNIVEIQDIAPGFDYNAVKVEIDVNGTKKTIELEDLNKVRAYYDITDHVDEGEDGHPLFEDVDAIAHELIDRIWNYLVGD